MTKLYLSSCNKCLRRKSLPEKPINAIEKQTFYLFARKINCYFYIASQVKKVRELQILN